MVYDCKRARRLKVLYSVFEPMQDNTTPPPNSGIEQSGGHIPSYPSHNKRTKQSWKNVASTILVIISAPLFALLLIAFVFQSYEVDGPSMKNTLQNGDRLIVVKTGKTIANIRGTDYIPDRGDIVVFAKLGTIDPTNGNSRQLIKRVIGLPGERVVVQSGRVTIFNEERPNGFNPDTTLGYADMIASTGGSTDVDITVPDGNVFVMGDNRSNSYDSRAFGPISSEEIIGTLALRIYPFDSAQTF